ncbi:MAG: Gfo/Idh/MocA family oxidoreductase [Christensenellaceae bacterium]
MRAAIVGLGVIGRVHAEVLRAQGETLCAVCDTDAEKLKDFSAAKYTDYLRLLDEERPDVVRSLPLHADMVTEALNLISTCSVKVVVHFGKRHSPVFSKRKSVRQLGSAYFTKTVTTRRTLSSKNI